MERLDSDILFANTIQDVPPFAAYIPRFITDEEEQYIIRMVDTAPKPKWTQLSNRRLQNWGGIPHKNGLIVEDIPKWLSKYIDKLTKLKILNQEPKPNHILVNEYLPGQGIMAHTDGPLFHPVIATISCGSYTLLEFFEKLDSDDICSVNQNYQFSLLLEPRSLLILKKDLYINYLHAISEVDTDDLSKHKIKNLQLCSENYKSAGIFKRDRRISLTIRHAPKVAKIKLKLSK